MLILLPPSETKRPGGSGPPLDVAALSFPELSSARRATLAELRRLSRNLATAALALKLGPRSAPEAARNRDVRSACTMPALERFDGVLFDALDAPSLPDPARRYAARTVAIHSALFGLVRADDLIPDYRLSHDSRLPDRSLRALWRTPITAVLASRDDLVIDLRSEGYVALGPGGPTTRWVRVVTEDAAGRRRALNHFGKAAKGRFARALLIAGVQNPDAGALCAWAEVAGIGLEEGPDGVLELLAPPAG